VRVVLSDIEHCRALDRVPEPLAHVAETAVSAALTQAVFPPIQAILSRFAGRLQAVHARDPALAQGAAAYRGGTMGLRTFPRLRSRFCTTIRAWRNAGFDEAHAPVTRQQVARLDAYFRKGRVERRQIRRAARRLRRLGVDAATAHAFLSEHVLDPAIPPGLRG
jgi:hypothetical protein